MRCQTFWTYIAWCWILLYFYKCSWALFWGNNLIFQGLLLLGEIRTAFSLGIIWPYYRGNTLLSSTLPDAWELDFHSEWWDMDSPRPHESFEDCSLQFFCVGFLQPQVVSSYACADQYSGGHSRRTLCRSLKPLSQYSPFLPYSSFWFYLSRYIPCPSWNSSFFSSSWGDCQALCVFLFLSCYLEVLSRQ